MELSDLATLLTPEGLRLLDSVGPVASTTDVAQHVSHLRKAGHSPELVSTVLTQARLRSRAQIKFGPFSERMLFTKAGLEQATRLAVAARHAGRFRDAGLLRVADLGCGIGGDALAFAGAGLHVHAVDADEVTAAIAAYNLAPFGEQAQVSHDTAEDTDLVNVDAVWLDPARRTAGHSETRRVQASDYSPNLDWAFDLASRKPCGIKLGPAHDRDELPSDAETQWVSIDGSVVELVVWSGTLARSGIRRSALVMRGGVSCELTAEADTPDADVRRLGAFLHEPDGAVIRARLIGDVARSLDAGMLDEHIAYLTSDSDARSPFVQSFRVLEEMALDVRTINAALKSREIGTLEIKKRGVDIDPAVFRRKLTLRGSQTATLLLVRVGSRRRAIVAERLSTPE